MMMRTTRTIGYLGHYDLPTDRVYRFEGTCGDDHVSRTEPHILLLMGPWEVQIMALQIQLLAHIGDLLRRRGRMW